MAKAMVTKYGMSDNIGLICYDNDDDEVFIGRDLAHTRGYSEGVASAIDQEIKRIIDECYAKAKQMIMDHRDVLDACANLLLEKEKSARRSLRRYLISNCAYFSVLTKYNTKVLYNMHKNNDEKL